MKYFQQTLGEILDSELKVFFRNIGETKITLLSLCSCYEQQNMYI